MNPLSTLCGGQDLSVTKTDGTQEVVRVIQFGVNLANQYAAIIQTQDEAREIEFLCNRPEGWAATLTPAAQECVLRLGSELNADFFSRWLARRNERAKLLPKPDMTEVAQMLEVLGRSNPGLLDSLLSKATGQSPTSPPRSP